MFHSIISDYDVFFAGGEEYTQSQNFTDIYSPLNLTVSPQNKNFFSTNPRDYLCSEILKNKPQHSDNHN
jgi:hypothetical protein